MLIQFKSRLEAHVLTENMRFYNYLEQSLSSDPNNTGVMHDFRREMNNIARGVIEFVKKYQSSNFTPEARRQFASDYEGVGKILEQRLDSEENNLYPLYQPN
ncbi:MAG: hemerythrin domain-containing protein [Rhodanobacteraceae bacterium]